MRQQSKLQSILLLVGGALMVIGAGCFVFMWQQKIMCWVFLVGAILFATCQSMQMYEGRSFVIRRLKRIQGVSNLLFVLSGILMVDTVHHFLLPLFRSGGNDGYYNYMTYVYNKWVVLLLIAAILEVYTTHRISSELDKEQNVEKR